MKVLLDKISWSIAICTTLLLSFSYHAAVIWKSLEHTFQVPSGLVIFLGFISLLGVVCSFLLYSRKSRGEEFRVISLYETVIYTVLTGALIFIYYRLAGLGLFLVDPRMVIGFGLLLAFIWIFYLKNPFRRLI